MQVGTLCVDTYEASVWSILAGSSLEGAAGDVGSTQCNTITAGDAVNTGSRSACKSNFGAFDMVGNVEWVADAAIGPVVTM